ncbi:MAG: Diguanylate kinase [Acidimicrobiales bacterium]|nr:Diguanylate kinase [Acidimicrobiales bacterium]
MRALADRLPVGVLCCREGRATYLNEAALRMLGVATLAEAAERPFFEYIDPDFRPLAESRAEQLRHGATLERPARQRLRRVDGTTVDIDVVTVQFEDDAGPGTYSVAVDVTEQLRAEEALEASEYRWRSLVHNASDIITVLAPDGTVKYSTPAAERLLGWGDDDNPNANMAPFVHADDMNEVAETFLEILGRPGHQTRTTFRVMRKDGSWCWVESIATNRMDDPAIEGIVCNVRDVSERVAAEEALRHQATHDVLTGLPNRQALNTAIEAIAGSGSGSALLLLDLDGFKDVNDGLGHDVGDLVLVEVAHRLRAATRDGDLVARLGGDEFGVLLSGLRSREAATVVAETLLAALDRRVELDGTPLHLGGSIGIAYYPEHGADATALLQAADVAMYRAKEEGMSWAVYSARDQQQRRHRLTLLTQLRQAIDDETVAVHYQPIVEPATGTVRSVEALARWTLPDGSRIEPDEFIPLAERTGLIRPLTRHVLTQALTQYARWRSEGLAIELAVNLAAPSLRDPNLVDMVSSALARTGVAAASLTFEITESSVADLSHGTMRTMSDLRELGVRFAIDDLGVGYSSMAYLKDLPISQVKVDRSFVFEIASDHRSRAIVRALIELGHSLGLAVVGEGVASAAAAKEIAALGCDLAQGFHYCKPTPGPELTGWLIERADPLLRSEGSRVEG